MEKIVGHVKIIDQLEGQVRQKEVSHAYLFSGLSGVGKKKTALYFAAMILCVSKDKPCGHCFACKQVSQETYPDLVVIGPGKDEATIKIKQIRQMIATLGVIPYSGEKRIIIIKEADKMTIEAQNSLLKSLEEPLRQNIFILLTDQAKGLLATIVSRCQSYHFLPLRPAEMVKALEDTFEAGQIKEILADAGGSVGQALYLLDHPEIREEQTQILREFYQILQQKELFIFPLAERLAGHKQKSLTTLNFLIGFLYEVRLIGGGHPLADQKEAIKAHHAFSKILTVDEIYEIIQTLFEMMENLHYNVNLRLQWEKCLIKIARKDKI